MPMDDRLDGVGLRILIVEDRADNAVSMAMLLGMYGHNVEIATDGPSALEKARTNEPDVVLLDLGLPGMSGYEVARQLSGHRPGKTPFLVAVTGYGCEEDRRHSAETGIDLHMLKPIDPEALCGVLDRFQRAIS
jgi:two-component system OmpR family response regulator